MENKGLRKAIKQVLINDYNKVEIKLRHSLFNEVDLALKELYLNRKDLAITLLNKQDENKWQEVINNIENWRKKKNKGVVVDPAKREKREKREKRAKLTSQKEKSKNIVSNLFNFIGILIILLNIIYGISLILEAQRNFSHEMLRVVGITYIIMGVIIGIIVISFGKIISLLEEIKRILGKRSKKD